MKVGEHPVPTVGIVEKDLFNEHSGNPSHN